MSDTVTFISTELGTHNKPLRTYFFLTQNPNYWFH